MIAIVVALWFGLGGLGASWLFAAMLRSHPSVAVETYKQYLAMFWILFFTGPVALICAAILWRLAPDMRAKGFLLPSKKAFAEARHIYKTYRRREKQRLSILINLAIAVENRKSADGVCT